MNKRKLAVRGLIGVTVVVALGLFAYANSGQRVDLRFGLISFRDISLPLVIYGAVVVGMLMMLAVGLRNDLRARTEARERGRIGGGSEGGMNVGEKKILEEVERRAR